MTALFLVDLTRPVRYAAFKLIEAGYDGMIDGSGATRLLVLGSKAAAALARQSPPPCTRSKFRTTLTTCPILPFQSVRMRSELRKCSTDVLW